MRARLILYIKEAQLSRRVKGAGGKDERWRKNRDNKKEAPRERCGGREREREWKREVAWTKERERKRVREGREEERERGRSERKRESIIMKQNREE